MSALAGTVAKFQARDVVRSRWLAAYVAFFWIVGEGLLRFTGGDARAVLSLGSIVLYVVPLVTLVFGTIYLYNAREFTELLLAQPVDRRSLYFGLYGGLTGPLCLGVVLGTTMPFLMRGGAGADPAVLALLCGTAVALTLAFAAIAFCIALACTDRLRGLGAAIGVWMLCAVVYDGLVMATVAAFDGHPLERPMLMMTLANPIDLARVMLLLRLDISALMGYTGAVFQQWLGGNTGLLAASLALCVWIVTPAWLGLRAFSRKDF
ncbi:MAG: ABC transporter permease subunit [Gemmatimonadaceae bacterium]